MSLPSDVVQKLIGKTLATAESLTGGGIGSALTAVPGCSAIYKGGVISYTNEIKHRVLGVDESVLKNLGAVSEGTAKQMASGVRNLMETDYAVSVTGLAGPTGDEFGNPVGTVFIGFASAQKNFAAKFCFQGNREEIRNQTIHHALKIVLENID